MIAYLRGTIIQKTQAYIILLVNGVGYKVEVGHDILEKALQEELELYIHTNVSQDNIRLIGFDLFEKLHLFQMLIAISGIGPKAGLNIMSSLPIEEIYAAISSQDSTIFKKVSGIGKKNAERIILELAGKLTDNRYIGATGSFKEDELELALRGLGYQQRDIEFVIKRIGTDGTTAARLKEALKLLSR